MDCDNQETEATKTIGSTDIDKVLKNLKNKHTKESIILLDYISKLQKDIEELEKENNEIRQWKYVIDNPIDLDKLKELDLVKIKGKKYIAETKIQEFRELLIKELDRDFITEEYRQSISCYFDNLLKE